MVSKDFFSGHTAISIARADLSSLVCLTMSMPIPPHHELCVLQVHGTERAGDGEQVRSLTHVFIHPAIHADIPTGTITRKGLSYREWRRGEEW